jgi:hypothetical protein
MATAPWLRFPCITPLILLPLVATFLFACAGANGQQPLFPVTTFYNPPNSASAFATGDFNGDGQPDIVFATPAVTGTSQFATLTVLLNNGASSPTSVVTNSLNCARVPQIVAADINNDKNLDLVISCVEGEIVVLFGNGDGTFQKPTTYTTSGTPSLAQPIDLNGDGYLDIAVSTPTAVLVMLNQGSATPGTLLQAKTYPVPTGVSIALSGVQGGDFDGDGKEDLIAVNTNTTQSIPFVIFYGNGDGTFQNAKISSQIPATGPFVVADFNHDGTSDVAYLTSGSPAGAPQSLQILLGSSNGNFTNSTNISLNGFTKYASLVYAGSTNGSKNVNLAIVGSNTTIIRGDGNGGFSLGPSYAISGTPLPQLSSNSTTNLLFLTPSGFSLLAGNSDGTFQGLPNQQVGSNGFVTADFNGDGLTDILTLNSLFTVNTGINLVTAFGRGDGTFLVTHQTPVSGIPTLLVAGDFNGDGKIDAVALQLGKSNSPPFITVYPGNGDGSFQSSPPGFGLPGISLPVGSPSQILAGDFNGDGKLDIIVAYPQQLVFMPGKGDSTFGTPVSFSAPASSSPSGPLLSADLNNDKLPDLIWNGAAYLSNGDGTFRQVPLGFTGTPFAIGDLNGDGIPDIVIQPPSVSGVAPPAAIYAGNGDGTFHSAALFTTTALSASTTVTSAVIGDVNADAHPDLILQYQNPNLTAATSVYLGDGKGNFTPDSNTYFAGGSIQSSAAIAGSIAVLTRLNNQAPLLPGDNALDYLTFTSGGATSLLNLSNPASTAPGLFSSTTSLSSNPTTAAPTQPIAFTVNVIGVSPAGTVTFTSGSATLGTSSLNQLALFSAATTNASFPKEGTYTVSADYNGDSNNQASSSNPVTVTIARVASTPTVSVDTLVLGANQVFKFIINLSGYAPTGNVTLSLADGTNIGTAQAVNGQASLPYFFPVAGTYTVYVNYAGDAANLPSVSSPFTLTVMPQDFNFSASGNEVTFLAGQGATATLTITPTYGYSGTVKFSCSPLLAGEKCIFTPPTVRPLDGFSSVMSMFVITTTAPTSARLRGLFEPLQGVTWASLLGLIFFRKRTYRAHKHLIHSSLFALLLALGLIQLTACSSSPSSTQTTPTQTSGTPKGTQTLIITAADDSGGPSHTVSVQLTID